MKFKKVQIPWNKGKKSVQISSRKGIHLSKELRGKISKNTKKAMANPEIKKKISESKKGQTPWNKGKKGLQISWIKGKHHSEETREKMRGRIFSEEHIRKLKESHKGKPSAREGKTASEETRKRLSESHKGKPSAMKGQHHTEEIKKRLRESSKNAWANPETRKIMIEANRIRYDNPESLEKIKRKSRETILKLFESGYFPKQTNTKPERQIKEELIKRGYIEGKILYTNSNLIISLCAIFVFPYNQVIVEVYGDFWHANPIKYAGKKLHKHQIKGINRDKSKEAYIKKVDNGSWNYFVIWEGEIKKNVSECVDKIEEVLKSKIIKQNI